MAPPLKYQLHAQFQFQVVHMKLYMKPLASVVPVDEPYSDSLKELGFDDQGGQPFDAIINN